MDPSPSVLVIPIPEADAAFGDVRRAHDPSGRDGMPAHVTVLTPFVPVGRWDARCLARLQTAMVGVAPFEARFRRPGRFGDSTLFLVPEPESTFRDLSRRVAAAFPEYPPYGGQFSEVLPHLTLVHGAPLAVLDMVQERVVAAMEVRSHVDALVIFSRNAVGRWVEGPRIALANITDRPRGRPPGSCP